MQGKVKGEAFFKKKKKGGGDEISKGIKDGNNMVYTGNFQKLGV